MESLLTYLEGSLIYGIGAIGLALSFRFLRFPDFTALGALVLGGCVGVLAANSGWGWWALGASAMAGGVLGLITAALLNYLSVPRVLAGIVVFVAAYTPSFWIAKDGGSISFPMDAPQRVLTPTFDARDTAILLGINVVLVCLIAVVIQSKYGGLLFALTADARFVRARHRAQRTIRSLTLFASNAIVGLAGGLYALKLGTAHVPDHPDFLPFALGGIFAGTAAALGLSAVADKLAGGLIETLRARGKDTDGLELLIMGDEGLSRRTGLAFATFVLGTVFVVTVDGALKGNAFATTDGRYAIPYALQPITYLLIALTITVSVWLSRAKEE